jgi:CRISPR-associated exonuclease Cas4
MAMASPARRPGQASPAPEQLTLTVTDVKNFVYCPRVVYFMYCLPQRPLTYKMAEGKLEHGRTEELEERRSLRAYGLTEGQREFKVHLASERLGLTGLLDMVVITVQEAIPVEFKNTTGPLGLNHKYQLVAYALLVEEQWDQPVRRGFVYRIPIKRSQELPITPNGRRFVLRALEQIRRLIATETMPLPTTRRGRCRDCEFRRFCNDLD